VTTHSRPIDDRELDALLRRLLVEGPTTVPDRMAESALLRVAATPQRRALRVRPVAAQRSTRLWLVGAAALLVVVVLGSIGGIPGIGPAPGATPSGTPGATPSGTAGATPSGTPAATPSTRPSPTATARNLVLFSSAADGYELLVPATWHLVAREFQDARRWAGEGGALMVSYGTSIFDGGKVSVCGPVTPEWRPCETQDYPYSVPYDPERDGVGPIDLSGYARDRCLGGCPIESFQTTLGGEAASLSRIEAGESRSTYISLFHDRRPLVLWWSEQAPQPADQQFEAMRASFRFLDETPSASPTQFLDPTELIPFVDTAAGYELRIPRYWAPTEKPLAPGVHAFGSGRGFGTRTDPAFTISVGDPDGTVTICQDVGHRCGTVVVESMNELQAVLHVRPESLAGNIPKGARTGELVIDGQPGGWKRPGYPSAPGGAGVYGLGGALSGGNCLGCPGVLYHAWTIKDGRPIVISIDFWSLAFDEFDPEYLAEIIDSVHLLD